MSIRIPPAKLDKLPCRARPTAIPAEPSIAKILAEFIPNRIAKAKITIV